MKQIIHFSDLHIGYGNLGQRFKIICNNLIFEKVPATDYVIVITGDLVEQGLEKAHFVEAKQQIERLEQAGFTVLVVPGNHDYGNGLFSCQQSRNRFKAIFFGTTNMAYPKLDIIENIAFIGLDSMADEVNWHDNLFAQGQLGCEQLNRLAQQLVQPEVRQCDYRVVYLHHHPFDSRFLHELKDACHLGDVLQRHGQIDALLYGHNHRGKKRNGRWHIPRCYEGGTTTSKGDAPAYHRIIDLSRDPRYDYDADFRGVF